MEKVKQGELIKAILKKGNELTDAEGFIIIEVIDEMHNIVEEYVSAKECSLLREVQGLRELVKAYAKAHAANPCDPDVTDDQVEAEDKLRKALILNPVAL